MCSLVVGGSAKSANHKGASQLDRDRVRALHNVLPAERFVWMATGIHQSAHRMHDRTGCDKRKDGKRRG